MTSKELADKLTPFVRDAVARSKDEILADLPKFQRAWAWMLWPTLLGIGVPMNTRVNIEFALYMYHKFAEKYFGPLVDAWISLNKDSTDPTIQELTEYLTILKQPTEEFLMVVQDVIREGVKDSVVQGEPPDEVESDRDCIVRLLRSIGASQCEIDASGHSSDDSRLPYFSSEDVGVILRLSGSYGDEWVIFLMDGDRLVDIDVGSGELG